MKKFVVLLVSLLMLIGCTNDNQPENELSKDGLQVKKVMEKNLIAIQEEDMEKYLSTLVQESREQTKKEIQDFFNYYDVKHKLLQFNVIEETETLIKVETEHQATANYIADGHSYRDHSAQSVHTFQREDGEWRISDSKIIETSIMN